MERNIGGLLKMTKNSEYCLNSFQNWKLSRHLTKM